MKQLCLHFRLKCFIIKSTNTSQNMTHIPEMPSIHVLIAILKYSYIQIGINVQLKVKQQQL